MMKAANREWIDRRWPKILSEIEGSPLPDQIVELTGVPYRPTLQVEGIQLSSGYDPSAEATQQAALVPTDALRATVYGLGNGEVVRVLLGRSTLQHLQVVILSRSLARLCLETYDHSDWLSDSRLELVLGDSLANHSAPFSAQPACLRLAEDSCGRLRDQVNLELATPYIQANIDERQQLFEQRLQENRGLIHGDGDVAELFGRWDGQTVFVAGAGPTLTDHLELLRASDAPLIAVDACVRPLLDAGAVPDIVVTAEIRRRAQLNYLSGDLAELESSTLVYSPQVHRDLLERWPGQRCAFYTAHARYAQLASELPRAALYCSGSVIHPAIDLAVQMGAARVVLFGADFSFPRGRSHASGVHNNNQPSSSTTGTWVAGGNGQRIPSLPNLTGYLRDLERYIAAHPQVRFSNSSREGARIEGTDDYSEALLGA